MPLLTLDNTRFGIHRGPRAYSTRDELANVKKTDFEFEELRARDGDIQAFILEEQRVLAEGLEFDIKLDSSFEGSHPLES